MLTSEGIERKETMSAIFIVITHANREHAKQSAFLFQAVNIFSSSGFQ